MDLGHVEWKDFVAGLSPGIGGEGLKQEMVVRFYANRSTLKSSELLSGDEPLRGAGCVQVRGVALLAGTAAFLPRSPIPQLRLIWSVDKMVING